MNPGPSRNEVIKVGPDDSTAGSQVYPDTFEDRECPDCRGTGTAERKLGKPDLPCPACSTPEAATSDDQMKEAVDLLRKVQTGEISREEAIARDPFVVSVEAELEQLRQEGSHGEEEGQGQEEKAADQAPRDEDA